MSPEATILNDLLCKGWDVLIFKNAIGSISVTVRREKRRITTDDFSVAKVIKRIHDKVHQKGEYAKVN